MDQLFYLGLDLGALVGILIACFLYLIFRKMTEWVDASVARHEERATELIAQRELWAVIDEDYAPRLRRNTEES